MMNLFATKIKSMLLELVKEPESFFLFICVGALITLGLYISGLIFKGKGGRMKFRQFFDNYRIWRKRSRRPYATYEKGDLKYSAFGAILSIVPVLFCLVIAAILARIF